MNEQQFLYILIAIISFDFILERLLEFLNLKAWTDKLPPELSEYYNQETYTRAQLYDKEKSRLHFISSTFNFFIIIIMLISGGFGWISSLLESYITHEIWHSLSFFAVIGVISTIINIPFGIYSTFVIEEKYGFNRTKTSTFIKDLFKGLVLMVIIGGSLGYFLLWIIDSIGPDFWFYAWIVFTAFAIFLNFFYTTLLVPIFNKLTPLPDGELKNGIEEYAKKVKFPLSKIFVMNGSKRSSKANAYFSGFGSKKTIVLYDTLIEKHSTEELVSILAHEVGHYKKKHVIISLIIGIIDTGFILWLSSLLLFNEQLSFALGSEKLEIHLNLLAIGILFGPISMITGILMNMLSRKNEFQADDFAVSTANGKAFEKALINLSVDNLSNLKPHPLYIFFHYSHPPLLERLRNINRER